MKKTEGLYVHGIRVNDYLVESIQQWQSNTDYVILSIRIGRCGYMHLWSGRHSRSEIYEDVVARVFLEALGYAVRSEKPVNTFAVTIRPEEEDGKRYKKHFTIWLDETEMARLGLELLGRPGFVRDLPRHEMNTALELVQCDDAYA